MIQTAPALRPVLDEIARGTRVAVDTEFHSERHYFPRLMLIQLRVDDGPAHLVDPLGGLDLRPLGAALSRVPLLLHGGAMDLQILGREALLVPCEVFDTQIAAGCAGGGHPIRLQDLVRRYLDINLEKTETLSDWSRRPLSDDQLRYAADDVLLLGPLAAALVERLAALGNSSCAASCMSEHLVRVLEPKRASEAWRAVAGAHVLDPRERAVLAQLAAWREESAQERDVPRTTVLSEGMLLDLARRQPSDVDSLRANRRMPSQVWKREGAAVLACVARGREALEIPGRPEEQQLWSELVMAAGRLVARDTGVARDLLLPERVLADIYAGRAVEPWREVALGEAFWEFVRQRKGIGLPGVWRS